MSLNVKTTSNPEVAAKFIASSVSDRLKSGKHVLLFLTGGSSIAVGIKIAELLNANSNKELMCNLTITLTDERYGPIDHINSNFFQLIEKGFKLPGAKIIQILIDSSIEETTEVFNKFLNEELMIAEYKIGLFGLGADGHTAGVLPDSEAVHSMDSAIAYDTPTFSRITITPKVIERLDEAIVWTQGKDKWAVLRDLEKEIDLEKQPAQILKKIPLLTIFSDYAEE